MFLTAITFIIVLSILVFVHELGHYLAARIIGVKVEEFGFGIPPRLWGKKIKGTIYSINWLPIGGFVRLLGEDDDQSFAKASDGKKLSKHSRLQYFWARSKKERAIILCSGVFMNFLLAVAITTVLLVRGVTEPTHTVRVVRVAVGSPAEIVGMKEQDIVTSVTVWQDDREKTVRITSPEILIQTVKDHAGEQITVDVMRNEKPFEFIANPRVNPPAGEGSLGIAISNLEKHTYSWTEAPVKAFVISAQRLWFMVTSLGNLVYRLVTGGKIIPGEVAGPVGIAQVTSEAVKYGIDAVLEFASVLSLNLVLVNIFPFPALDGGRLAFVVFEKLGKKARPEIERTIHQIGMMILLGLLLLITFSDIMRLVRG